MPGDIDLRPLDPSDGRAIAQLSRETPDTGAVRFYNQFHHDAYTTLMALHPGATGVVAQASDRLVGIGLVTFGECWFEGELRPFAYLSSLSVHPEYRRRGIASQIADWRVHRAHEHFRAAGRQGVIYAAIQSGNIGSIRTAASWSTQHLASRHSAAVTSVRRRPPRRNAHVEVRTARLDELERVAQRQNAFYDGYNLYTVETADDLEAWRAQELVGMRLRDVVVAVDRSGDIVAGMGVTPEGPLITAHVLRMPPALRVANALLHIVPTSGIATRAKVERFWFASGEEAAGTHLWESIRWLFRDRATNVMTFFDGDSPIRQAIRLPAFMPKPSRGSIVLNAPVPADPARPVYVIP
jgi:ribosomal protein S18 acetylase RimI-like enzyme